MVDIEALKNFEIFVVISRRLKARESELIKALDRQ